MQVVGYFTQSCDDATMIQVPRYIRVWLWAGIGDHPTSTRPVTISKFLLEPDNPLSG